MDASASDTLDNIVVNLKPKRFLCARCQRRFARLEHLQRHERTHTRERPFPCGRCESRFTRSDLLIRHERLSHGSTRGSSHPQKRLDKSSPSTRVAKRSRPKKTSTNNQASPDEEGSRPDLFPSLPPSPPYTTAGYAIGELPNTGHVLFQPPVCQSLQRTSVDSIQLPDDATAQPTMIDAIQGPSVNGDIDGSMNRFTRFLEANTLAAYHLSSPDTIGQADFLFSFEPFMGSSENEISNLHQLQVDINHTQQTSFSCFCSRLPSVQPDHQRSDANLGPSVGQLTGHRRVFDVTCDARELILQRMADFADVISDFQLPTGLSLSRYIRGYVDGFHEHLPFLHIQSMSASASSIELLLAMAAVGAQYCFESEKGVSLFHAARAIANERIRRRDAGLTCASQQHNQPGSCSRSPSQSTGIGLPSTVDDSAGGNPTHDLIQTAQALLILMAMATWSKHGELLREALAIQSVLASIIREDGLRMPPPPDRDGASWEAMMRHESVIRTKYIVFCFFNLHCILYDIPPLILSSELQMNLPCTAAEFRADTAAAWEEARRRAEEPSSFHDTIRWLFSRSSPGQDMTTRHSSLANYVLIHGIIQHIFFVRQNARCRIDLPDSDLTQEDRASIDRALRNWQMSWELSPESCLDPTSAQGPVAFNSTALLRLAHVRLAIDTGPERALGTRDPIQIANALRSAPAIKRCPKLTRALLHSAHAFSIPIKIGVRLVAKTQTFIWSIQHSLSSLECALLLSKWLAAISAAQWPGTDGQLTADERKVLGLVKTMLDETEFAVPDEVSRDIAAAARQLNIGMLRVWATIFRGSQTWRIVDVIGSSLDLYADMLEAAG
ncbi:hypothetical protein C8A03DRAFT_42846 [Achaetomium macrosporum]|uniref:C2H2-type domain-containing protein n=1 Tax=Achaetomium macrosporum TaxID=79813 RepID=A0AAN7HF07_9PEZI|nr:hypothetical protein C8A03DRAFT_42846 [Achaetomium macrosporum]